MPALPQSLARTDRAVTKWMADHAVTLTRVALGVVFLWFGFLKFFPGLSSEEPIATRTMRAISFGLLQPGVSRPLLATWECVIGLGLLTGKALRLTLLLLFVQMLGTLLPLVIFPGETFKIFPVVPTLQGQFIMKNLVLIAAGIFIGSTVRGGKIVADPGAAHAAKRVENRAAG
jgi:uncharacterized membrane protein YphA (DoxX/SURF4 family)